MRAFSFGHFLITAMLSGICVAGATAQPAAAQANPDPTGSSDTDTTRMSSDNPASKVVLSNPIGDQHNMVDRLVTFRGKDWAAGTAKNLVPAGGDGSGLMLNPENTGFPARGSWASPEVTAEYPFTEVLPSWNIDAPENTGLTFEVRVKDSSTGEWSPYLYMGHWGSTLHSPDRTIEFDGGQVHNDILQLDRPASAFQIQARLYSYDLKDHKSPSLRRLSAVYTGRIEDAAQYEKMRRKASPGTQWARSLEVPFTPQGDNPKEISGSTCSPTSTNMVLGFRGIQEDLTTTALGIYDEEYGIFGTWNRSVAYASSKGLNGYLTRMRTWDDVREQISLGNPVIASIRFRAGEFPSNVLKSTGGHLVVIRGMTKDGDPIMNDPASREKGKGVVYKADELGHAWFDKGGVAYIILPKDGGKEPAQNDMKGQVAGN